MLEEYRQLAFLRYLDDASLALLEARVRDVPRRAFVFRQGEDSGTAFVIASGQIRISVLSAGGAEMTLDVLAPGDVFGIAGLADMPRLSNAMATAETRLVAIPTRALRVVTERHPALFQDLLQQLLRRLSRSIQEQVASGTQRVYARVAARLLLLSEASEGHGERRLPPGLSHAELASMIGSTRATVTRVLQDMRARGLLDRDGNQLVIRAAEELQQISEVDLPRGMGTVSP